MGELRFWKLGDPVLVDGGTRPALFPFLGDPGRRRDPTRRFGNYIYLEDVHPPAGRLQEGPEEMLTHRFGRSRNLLELWLHRQGGLGFFMQFIC
jgi:hypothetical protein